MENLINKNFAFFMNHFSSLKKWDENGTFTKETKLYIKLAENFNTVYIFSYGDSSDLCYSEKLPSNIVIVPKPSRIPTWLYEIILPFVHRKIIRKCEILKSNQNSGAIAPAIVKLFFPNKFFIARSGYIGSEFARLSNLSNFARFYFFVAENFSYRLCDKAFIPEGDLPTLLLKYPFLKNKLISMNNAINTDLFRKIDVEKKYDIVYQGRLDNVQKNHQALLSALDGLNLSLLLIGKGTAKNEIAKQASERKINLTIMERVENEELPSLYNCAKICAFPSLFEGNPKALLECMSCEMPIAAFSVTGVKNLIRDYESGLLSEPDINLLRSNIQKLLKDSALAEKCGANARKFILENYSFDKLFQKELSVYQDLISN